jgi:hypothetical protein
VVVKLVIKPQRPQLSLGKKTPFLGIGKFGVEDIPGSKASGLGAAL